MWSEYWSHDFYEVMTSIRFTANNFFVCLPLFTVHYVDPQQVAQALQIHRAKENDPDELKVNDDTEVKRTETISEGTWVL